MGDRHVRLVLPHQLFVEHLDVPRGTVHVLVEGTFVRDHHDVFAGNPRSRMIARLYDGLAPETRAAHTRRAQGWLA